LVPYFFTDCRSTINETLNNFREKYNQSHNDKIKSSATDADLIKFLNVRAEHYGYTSYIPDSYKNKVDKWLKCMKKIMHKSIRSSSQSKLPDDYYQVINKVLDPVILR
jgi:hypothetical protein